MKKQKQSTISRREFISNSAKATIILGFPSIVPASVFGKNAPSNRINIGAIGTGRISRIHDLPGVWQYPHLWPCASHRQSDEGVAWRALIPG